MTNTDKLLERLVKRVNDSGDLFDLTLTVRGAMLTGRLIPRATWLGENISLLETAGAAKGFVDDFAAEGGAFDTEDYLHLSDVKVVFGVELPVPAGSGLVRIPVAAVDSWAVGRMDVQRAE